MSPSPEEVSFVAPKKILDNWIVIYQTRETLDKNKEKLVPGINKEKQIPGNEKEKRPQKVKVLERHMLIHFSVLGNLFAENRPSHDFGAKDIICWEIKTWNSSESSEVGGVNLDELFKHPAAVTRGSYAQVAKDLLALSAEKLWYGIQVWTSWVRNEELYVNDCSRDRERVKMIAGVLDLSNNYKQAVREVPVSRKKCADEDKDKAWKVKYTAQALKD